MIVGIGRLPQRGSDLLLAHVRSGLFDRGHQFDDVPEFTGVHQRGLGRVVDAVRAFAPVPREKSRWMPVD